MDYYQILGVSRNATQSEILQAYRKLALQCHPDRNLTNTKESAEQFKKVAAAFEVLSDFGKRARYNRKEPERKVKQKKKTEKGPFDNLNDPNLGNCRPGRAPMFDIWGKKLTSEERRKWEEDAARDAIESPQIRRHPIIKKDPPPRLGTSKGFVDVYSKQYLKDDLPKLR